MLIDGQQIATGIKNELALKIKALKRAPCLAFILVGHHVPSQTYVGMKSKACSEIGMRSIVKRLPQAITQPALIQDIETLNKDDAVDGIIVQLPLPPHLDNNIVTASVDPTKDVDGLHPLNIGKMLLGREDGFFPCTPHGVLTLLESSSISTQGQHVVILGRSNLVGKPLATLLIQKKPWGNATVTLTHTETKNLSHITKEADILIAAMGQPLFVKADMVKKGVVVIDVGINSIPDLKAVKGYRIVGDVDFKSVSPKCRAITPVPGGVGPMTIAALLQHTFVAYQKKELLLSQ